MRQADIEIGGEYAWGSFHGLSRVRVTDKGRKTSDWSSRVNAVEVEHVAGWPFEGRKVAQTRDLAPWEQRHDDRLERERVSAERAERIARVADRLNVAAAAMHGHWVRIEDADFFALAERLGVDTD